MDNMKLGAKRHGKSTKKAENCENGVLCACSRDADARIKKKYYFDSFTIGLKKGDHALYLFFSEK